MALDSVPPATSTAPQATPVSSTDVANASQLNVALSQIQTAVSNNNSAVITAINSIASAVTNSMLGGGTGTTPNALVKSKGTSGLVVQPSTIICDGSNNLSGLGNLVLNTGKALQTSTSAANTALLQAYNTNTAAYVTFGTLTANNPPTFDLSASTTLGGVNIATLNTNTWNQQQGFPEQTLTDGATISWNAQTQQTATVTLGGNRTLANPTNLVAGFTYILRVKQDGSGSRTLAYGANYKWPNGVAPVLSTGVSATDILTFYSDGTNMYGAIQKNFS